MVISVSKGCLRLQIDDECDLENPEFSIAVSRAQYFNQYDDTGAVIDWDEEIIKNVRALRAEFDYIVNALRENRKNQEGQLCAVS